MALNFEPFGDLKIDLAGILESMRRGYWVGREQEELKYLREELYSARRTIVGLMTEEREAILMSFYLCESRESSYQWEGEVFGKIIATIPEEDIFSSGLGYEQRAYCPLCGAGTTGPFESGYKVPGGMEWHFAGHGKTYQCPVILAALSLACGHWDEKFSEAEAEERKRDEVRLKERLQTEDLYVFGPGQDPELIDQGFSVDPVRSSERLRWAEVRLQNLGFECVREGRSVSYVKRHDSVEVYADHRREGRISFFVFPSQVKKRARGRKSFRRYSTFHILDSWKNALPSKLEKRLKKAAAEVVK